HLPNEDGGGVAGLEVSGDEPCGFALDFCNDAAGGEVSCPQQVGIWSVGIQDTGAVGQSPQVCAVGNCGGSEDDQLIGPPTVWGIGAILGRAVLSAVHYLQTSEATMGINRSHSKCCTDRRCMGGECAFVEK